MQNGLLFQTGLRYGEDWAFATKYLAHCSRAGILDRYGYFYRTRSDSVSHTVTYSQTDAIIAAKTTAQYLVDLQHPFADIFCEYMPARATFSVAHRFCNKKNMQLFQQLRRDYDLTKVMVSMVCNPYVDVKSKLAAGLYLVSPYLFYMISIF